MPVTKAERIPVKAATTSSPDISGIEVGEKYLNRDWLLILG